MLQFDCLSFELVWNWSRNFTSSDIETVRFHWRNQHICLLNARKKNKIKENSTNCFINYITKVYRRKKTSKVFSFCFLIHRLNDYLARYTYVRTLTYTFMMLYIHTDAYASEHIHTHKHWEEHISHHHDSDSANSSIELGKKTV